VHVLTGGNFSFAGLHQLTLCCDSGPPRDLSASLSTTQSLEKVILEATEKLGEAVIQMLPKLGKLFILFLDGIEDERVVEFVQQVLASVGTERVTQGSSWCGSGYPGGLAAHLAVCWMLIGHGLLAVSTNDACR